MFKDAYRKKAKKENKSLSYPTIKRMLKNIRDFFLWLSNEPGFKSKIKINDVNVMNLTLKEENIANAKKLTKYPTEQQVYKMIEAMPYSTPVEKRNKAIIAFLLCTGVRGKALLSLKLNPK